MKQTVYVFRCENSVVQIKGKVNSVTVDGCKKTSVVFDNLLSQVEVINSQSIEVQTLGTLPTVSIQKTDGCQVYLSKESLSAEIVTSKSSEMNILAPQGDDFVSFVCLA
jgi:adenylyl cyclase-associated protein